MASLQTDRRPTRGRDPSHRGGPVPPECSVKVLQYFQVVPDSLHVYLCHRVFLSSPVDTDTLQSRGDTKHRGRTHIFLRSQNQKVLDHKLCRKRWVKKTPQFTRNTELLQSTAVLYMYNSSSLLSHLPPVQPGRQLHRPVALSH